MIGYYCNPHNTNSTNCIRVLKSRCKSANEELLHSRFMPCEIYTFRKALQYTFTSVICRGPRLVWVVHCCWVKL